MQITVWGARGSIPVSGEQYLRYGGDTTCVELEPSAGDTFILDAGTGLRGLGNKLLAEGKTTFHFLLSHAHWDHLLGFPYFKPLYRAETKIHLHGCTNAQASIRSFFAESMKPPYFPLNLSDVPATITFDDVCPPQLEICGLQFKTILLNHPNHGYGVRITDEGRSFAFFPDNELSHAHPKGGTFADYVRFLEGVDVLIHDAEYLPEEYEAWSKGWGHSTFTDTVRLAGEAGVDRLILWHLNQDRSDDDVDDLLKQARAYAATLEHVPECEMGRTGMVMAV
ncbi:MBL fold metallo-hydrolase [Gemmatimonadota bacterium]